MPPRQFAHDVGEQSELLRGDRDRLTPAAPGGWMRIRMSAWPCEIPARMRSSSEATLLSSSFREGNSRIPVEVCATSWQILLSPGMLADECNRATSATCSHSSTYLLSITIDRAGLRAINLCFCPRSSRSL